MDIMDSFLNYGIDVSMKILVYFIDISTFEDELSFLVYEITIGDAIKDAFRLIGRPSTRDKYFFRNYPKTRNFVLISSGRLFFKLVEKYQAMKMKICWAIIWVLVYPLLCSGGR